MSNEANKYVIPSESLEVVEAILNRCEIIKEKTPKILEVVKYHEDKNEKLEVEIECKIIQDADALDAIGKIGLKRTLNYCRSKNVPISNNDYSLDCQEYIPNINPISTCHYICRTMIPNSKNLHTSTAKDLAKGKIKILERFVERNTK